MKDKKEQLQAESRQDFDHFSRLSIHLNNLLLPDIIRLVYKRFYPKDAGILHKLRHAIRGHAGLLVLTGSKLKLYTSDLEFEAEFNDNLNVLRGCTTSINASVMAILCFNSYHDNFLCSWSLETKTVISQLRLRKRGYSYRQS